MDSFTISALALALLAILLLSGITAAMARQILLYTQLCKCPSASQEGQRVKDEQEQRVNPPGQQHVRSPMGK